MHFKLTLAVACFACLAVLSDARPGRGRGRPQGVRPWRGDSSSSDEDAGSRFRGFDGRRDSSSEDDSSEEEGRGPSGKGPSGRDGGRKHCGMARHACLVEDADGNQLKNKACPVNTTCTRGPVQIQKDGQTYNFTFCSGRPAPREHMCVPACSRRGPGGKGPTDSDQTPDEEMPEMPETPLPEGGADGPTTGRPEPLTDDVLPPADQSEAEDIFCQQPAWYMLACSVSDAATGATIKQVSCVRDGNCTRGPGEYLYNGTAVQAYFCEDCEEREDRPQGTRPWGRRPHHGGRPDRRPGQGERPEGDGQEPGQERTPGRPDRSRFGGRSRMFGGRVLRFGRRG